jgi:hypothetical protein
MDFQKLEAELNEFKRWDDALADFLAKNDIVVKCVGERNLGRCYNAMYY